MSKNLGKIKEKKIEQPNSIKTKGTRTPVHFNGNQLCAVGWTSTKSNSDYFDGLLLKEISIIPIGADYKAVPEMSPITLEVAQDFGKLEYGIDEERAADILYSWFKDLRLPYGKGLVFLAWEAFSLKNCFGEYLDYVHTWRDLQQIAFFMNDLANRRGERIPFPKSGFGSSSRRALETDNKRVQKDSFFQAHTVAQFYRYLLYRGYKLD